MFLFKYLSRINIMHRFDKTHQNVDEFSKLLTFNNNAYSIVFLNVDNEFRSTIRESLFFDFHFEKLYKRIQNQIDEIKNSEIKLKTVY